MNKKKIIEFLNYYFKKFGNKNIIDKYWIEHDIDITIHDITIRGFDGKTRIYVDSEPQELEHSIQDENENNINFSEAVWDELKTALSIIGLDLEKMDYKFNKRGIDVELPFDQENISESVKIRVFSENVNPEELKWHTDEQDRVVIPLVNTDWKLQIDNQLPTKLLKNKKYFIPEGVYHRIIKGSGDLSLKVILKI